MNESRPDCRACFQYLCKPLEEFYKDCQVQNVQGSGPGGQHRNRVKTGVELLHRPTRLKVRATTHREAKRNQQDALRQLRLQLALLMATPLADTELVMATQILDDWHKQIPPLPAFRAKINPEHNDFALLVGLALLALEMHRGQLKETADQLGCSSSALVRFLKLNKHVWQTVAGIRIRYGQGPLH